MTISISVSVNGGYKCPVTIKQGGHSENHVVSGFGLDRPNVLTLPFRHGGDIAEITVGPESPDDGTPEPPPHVQRMIAERDELKDRLEKLESFLVTDTFNALDNEEQNLLHLQAKHMDDYLMTLGERIRLSLAKAAPAS